jgi:hypothetical protein
MLNFKVLSRNSPGGAEENHENLRIAGLRVEILTWDPPNTKQVS